MSKHNLKSIQVFAAPLCGYTSFAYREILRQYPYDMMFTEMVSIDALAYKNKQTESIFAAPENQPNLGVQLFGSNIDHFLYSIDYLSKLNKFQVFDINCGCPVPKVMKSGGGSALLKNPENIYKIVQALTAEFPHLDITTKIRLGINKEYRPYLDIASAIENGGAKRLTVHGRNQNQRYDGDVDLEAIAEIKKTIKIPVIGNGGIFTPEDAKYMVDMTQVDGVMVARGMIGAPWIAQQIKDYFATGSYLEPTYIEKISVLKQHFLAEHTFSPNHGFREFKKTGVSYLKGIKNSKHWKVFISLASSAQEMEKIITQLEAQVYKDSLEVSL